MQHERVTRISLREDRPTAISSTINGANINSVGFNTDFIALRRPNLAVKLLELFAEANEIKPEDHKAPDEDFESAMDAFNSVSKKVFDEDE